MSKARVFFAMLSIVAILLAVNHVLHFVSPLIQLGSMDEEGTSDIADDGDDLTTFEFLEMASTFENYDWSNYNPDDFPDWLYMPDELPTTYNASEVGVPPFYGYNWSNYNPDDFPNWLIMPDQLPSDFNATDPEYVMDFVGEHIDPTFVESMEDGMSDLADVENPEDLLSGDNFDLGSLIGSIISVWELVFAILNIGAALIFLVISRSVD